MPISGKVEVLETYCRLRLPDTGSLVDVVESVTHAIVFCRRRRSSRLLADLTRVPRSISPTFMDRYLLAEEWSKAAAGEVAVAIVAHPEQIDPRKFGIGVATNFGMLVDVFTSEGPALDWLLGHAKAPGAGL